MSRVAKNPINIPAGVDVSVNNQHVKIKGPKGSMEHEMSNAVSMKIEDNSISFEIHENFANAKALAGTTRALVNNMVTGVNQGFEKKLTLIGVGYRAQVQGKALNLTLGYSHPIVFPIPDELQIETPSQTEVIIRGSDKQMVGQAAANIRAYRPPEPYKGKGVRYTDEHVVRKEAKKK